MNRREKRRIKFEQEKALRRMYSEYKSVRYRKWGPHWRQDGEAGHWEDIQPYRYGWTRTLVLRSDIKRRKDADYIEEALSLVNTEDFSRRKDFRKWRRGRLVNTNLTLRNLSVEKWEKQPDYIRKYFEKGYYYSRIHHQVFPVYFFKYPWFFVHKITPRMVDKRWIPNGEFESEREKLDQKVRRMDRWGKIVRWTGGFMRKKDGYYNNWTRRQDAWAKQDMKDYEKEIDEIIAELESFFEEDEFYDDFIDYDLDRRGDPDE